MRRIWIAVPLALSLCAAPLAADAQQAGKVYRLGYLTQGASSNVNPELVINLKTARALGLTIPQSLLLRADQVIQ